jgi:hypothetical protein
VNIADNGPFQLTARFGGSFVGWRRAAICPPRW